MALVDNAWYVNFGDGSTTGYYAVTKWANITAVAGQIIRQFTAPAVGSERCFVCTVAGATGAVEPTWTVTRGAINASSTARYTECTGIAALNGDATNTPSWTITATPPGGVKGTAVTLGQVIKRDSGASYQICTVAGTAGSGAEPAFSNTAGTTTADNTVTWTSLGVVGNFTGWQAPHARLANAFTATWGQAGNAFFVASAHAETQSTAITLTVPSTAAAPCNVYCTSTAAAPPTTVTTGASISTTGNSAFAFTASAGIANVDGIAINCGSGAVSPLFTITGLYMRNCAVAVVATGGIAVRASNSVFDNTTFAFTATGQNISTGSNNTRFVWKNTPSAILGGTLPATLFSGPSSVYWIQGVDLSALGSGKTLVNANASMVDVTLVDCKLGASVTVAAAPTTQTVNRTNLIRCDSGATNYRDERYWYEGTQTVDTTIIRTSGATDGATPISWKLVSTANSKWICPFESQPITIWNDSTSAITTLTIYGTTTGGGVPNNDDIWVEVEYLGSGSTPQGSFITTTKADNLAAAAATNNSSDASTWGGGGVGNGFKIVVPSFTPGQKGPIYITVKVAKASATYYIDPVAYITGQAVSKSFIAAPGVYVNSAGGISRARAFAGFA